MSDDDRDIDVESDEEDDDSTSPTNMGDGTQFMTQAEKRAHHNALERKRRDHIKESFSGLRDSIPSMHGEKVAVSRAQVLKKATDYIQYMRRKNNTHQQDIEDLRRQNDLLDQQVRALEKARSAGTYVSQSSDSTKHFDAGSGSDSSETGLTAASRRKKLKTK